MSSRILPLDVLFLVPRTLRKIQALRLVLAIFLFSAPCWSQQTQPSPQGPQEPPRPDVPPGQQVSPQAPEQNPAPLTLPVGTQLALVLTHPIDSKAMHPGSTVFAETTAPVLADDQVVIPAGAFVQGRVKKLTRQGSRAQLLMQSVSVALTDGSVINLKGPLEMMSGEGTAWRNPGSAAKAGALLAPLVGLGLGSAIGAAAHTTQTTAFAGMTVTTNTPNGIAIGSMTGIVAGTIVSVALIARSRHFYVGEGSPLEMILSRPVTVVGGQGAEAARLMDR
jgi:hypothetical protein